MINTKDLVDYLNKLLNIYDYQDYGPNGLQIQGMYRVSQRLMMHSGSQHNSPRKNYTAI